MKEIIMTLADGTTMKVSADSIDTPVEFTWGHAIVLRKKVALNGVALPKVLSSELGNSIVCALENGQTFQGNVKIVAAGEDTASLRIYTAENSMEMMQANPLERNKLSTFDGGFGPFKYKVDINLDWQDIMKSSFIVKLTFSGITVIDVHLDAQNPTVNFSLTIFGTGVSGTLGVDFEKQCVYVSAHVKFLFYDETFNFEVYNWSKSNRQVLSTPENTADRDNAIVTSTYETLQSTSNAGSVIIRNTGAYVAKFAVDFDLNGTRCHRTSGDFTAGVNKEIDIPADATNIKVQAYAAVFFGSWSSIFAETYSKPDCRSYHVSGTTLKTKWGHGL